MASFFDTTVGQQVEFQRVLASAGFTDSDIARIIKDPKLASSMYAAIQPNLASQTLTPTDIVARVERQLARYEEVGIVITDDEVRHQILADAAAFVPFSEDDRPLVTSCFGILPTVFNVIYAMVQLGGYDTVRGLDTAMPIRFADGMAPKFIQPRLVHFEPNSYQGESPSSALTLAKKDNIQLAGVEIAEMLFVEPEWALEWNGTDHPFPNASGLELKYDGNWSHVPCLDRWDVRREVNLHVLRADDASGHWSSPSVREC